MNLRIPHATHALQRLPWPGPALLAWAAGWAGWWLAGRAAVPPGAAVAVGVGVSCVLAAGNAGRWRQAIAGLGFPLSALVLGPAAALPPWAWLLLMLPLLAVYPLRAWRDAPFFPTPARALAGLDGAMQAPRRVLDAGCGLGHGLAALHRLWPQAELHGVEWSPLLAWAGALRCRYARVRRGDMWAASWSGHDLVYVFQRPESMARVYAKAQRELAPTAWLVSLEFAVPGIEPRACLSGPGRRPLWVYCPGAAPERSISGGTGR